MVSQRSVIRLLVEPTRLGVVALLLTQLFPVDGSAQIAVVPAGSGKGLTATAAVGRGIVKQLKKNTKKARLVYILPEFPSPKRRLGRKARRLMKKAHKSFQMMEYSKAMGQAEQALKVYKNLCKHGKGKGYVESQHLIAASAFFAGDNPRASKAMNDAHLADPNPPPKKQFSPQVLDLYAQVVSEPAGAGGVELRSNPEGALIWFHNKLIGPARGKIRIRAGLYLVRAYLPGHGLYQRWFRVRPHETRQLLVTLKKDDTPEPELMSQLRDEANGEEPGATVNQLALDNGVSDVVLLTAAQDCTSRHCPIHVVWARDGRWIRRKNGTYNGRNARQLAGMWIRNTTVQPPTSDPNQKPNVVAPTLPPGIRACTLDSQCGIRERCVGGRCQTVTPITHKWWFWTLIGAGVAGATAAIVIPLTRPDAPVINVQ